MKMEILGGSVGADRRAAPDLTREFAAMERGDHLQVRIFMKVRHDLFQGYHRG